MHPDRPDAIRPHGTVAILESSDSDILHVLGFRAPSSNRKPTRHAVTDPINLHPTVQIDPNTNKARNQAIASEFSRFDERQAARSRTSSKAEAEMAMERFLTALVFCEAPLDAAYLTSVTTGVKLVSTRTTTKPGDVMKPAAAAAATEAKADAKKLYFSGKSPQRQAGYEPAFDGLNCFETVVMH